MSLTCWNGGNGDDTIQSSLNEGHRCALGPVVLCECWSVGRAGHLYWVTTTRTTTTYFGIYCVDNKGCSFGLHCDQWLCIGNPGVSFFFAAWSRSRQKYSRNPEPAMLLSIHRRTEPLTEKHLISIYCLEKTGFSSAASFKWPATRNHVSDRGLSELNYLSSAKFVIHPKHINTVNTNSSVTTS